jgi:DNA-binding MarR family transcriptional regulator
MAGRPAAAHRRRCVPSARSRDTAEAQRAEFGYLREALGLTPGNLSKHLTALEQAGMIEVEKGYTGRRPRTWVRITAQGRAALAAELAALTELLRRHATADNT